MTDQRDYTIAIVKLDEEDGGGYYGFVPDLPGCGSDGETRDEALVNTAEALSEWLETQSERGRDIPAPGSAIDASVLRERKLLDAIQSLAEYQENADEKIASLEGKLRDLILVLKDDVGRVPVRFTLTSPPTIPKKLAH
jgi:antitoxin HicB